MAKENEGTGKSGTFRKVAALGALAVAGYYFYAGKNAEKNRKNAAQWAKSFKKEVMKQLENAKEINRETVGQAVDRAVGVYESLRAVDTSELVKAAGELKDHWNEFAEEFAHEGKRSIRTIRRGFERAMADVGKDKDR